MTSVRAAEPDRQLIAELCSSFSALADPQRAASQQAYMKSSMPHYGIATPQMRQLCRAAFGDHTVPSAAAWEATALALWREARHREERYAALELLGHKPYRSFFHPELIATLEELIVSGAWWDYVDQIAINFVGLLLTRHPEPISPVLQNWSRGGDLWLRRSAMLAQLKFKEQTDWALLREFIDPSLDSKEFFLRKAIGWVLREYAKTNPEAVLEYVADHREHLSGLSRREALRVLRKNGTIAADDPRF